MLLRQGVESNPGPGSGNLNVETRSHLKYNKLLEPPKNVLDVKILLKYLTSLGIRLRL